ncbi:MAG: Uncharacterized protein G01um101449_9 [Parcubacteria group bacterium Gr01-1014_49]|nr:MAG: Uncharacterized protein G01um101449_9 [Parcubacteria group bacterium Gr01-1014_49]
MDKMVLEKRYIRDKKSVHDIARELRCSQGKINYWLKKHSIQKRSISEAVYTKYNPNGDPFSFKMPRTSESSFLFGLGLGLYWGEGTKVNLHSVRLGNTDPHLTRTFITFLRKIYDVDESRLRFGLQIFRDMNQKKEEQFWQHFLKISPRQFYKTINTRSGSIGTYRAKSKHGVLTVYFHNRKLRDILIGEIERIRELR